jgi:hypothetical protein
MRLLVCIFFPFIFFSQRSTFKSKSELGFFLGGSNYIGDLNPYAYVLNSQLAGGIIYKYNMNPRISLRANVFYGSVKADDADSKTEVLRNRNLNFQSTILEFAGGLEFSYLPFQIGSDKYRGSAYLLAEIGLFKMNPRTKYNDQIFDLQSIGTEGQGSSLSSRKAYNLIQLTIPLGVGIKLSLGKRMSMYMEYGIRKTFTDYLDDVGSDSYVDPVQLLSENGELAAALSNRSLDGNRYGVRGNSSTKDWYSFFGLGFCFKLGVPTNCYYHH